MDVVVIAGGLGNQMSQYAFYLSKKQTDKQCCVIFNPYSATTHNGSELGRVFGIHYGQSLTDKFLVKVFKVYDGIPRLRKYFTPFKIKELHEKTNYDFTPSLLTDHQHCGIRFLKGGWHSEKYFVAIKDRIKSLYKFNTERQGDAFKAMEAKIVDDSSSVSVHIRRGDYVNHPDFDGIADEDYYRRSISDITSRIHAPHFYVFSNDKEWSKDLFKRLNVNYTMVDVASDQNSYLDMYMMSICRHHIIANSTFSWWAAWLCPYNDSITIHPKRFIAHTVTKDIYPERWLSL